MIDLLVSARKGAGVTQEVLAERLGKRQSCASKVESKVESRERRVDVIEFIEKITRVIEVLIDARWSAGSRRTTRSADDPSTPTTQNCSSGFAVLHTGVTRHPFGRPSI